jgi:disulfide bond formation protein DsbB
LAVAVIVGGPALVLTSEALKPREPTWAERRAAREAALPALELGVVAKGRRLYESGCVACHGSGARGVANMGKDLVEGEFARGADDAALFDVVTRGRLPGDPAFKGPMPMPPRGGRADYTDDDVRAVVAYLRALQVPGRVGGRAIPEDAHVETLDGPAEATPAMADAAKAMTAPGSEKTGDVGVSAPADESGRARSVEVAPVGVVSRPGPIEVNKEVAIGGVTGGTGGVVVLDPEAVKRGKRVYASCIACHAKDGSGMRGMGADLLHSGFVKRKTDAELREFIKSGRAPGAPDSVMNMNMPPKGGNPALKDAQIDDVIAYLRSLQQSANAAK